MLNVTRKRTPFPFTNGNDGSLSPIERTIEPGTVTLRKCVETGAKTHVEHPGPLNVEFFADRTVDAHVMLMSNPDIGPASVMLISILNKAPFLIAVSTTALDFFTSLKRPKTAGLFGGAA